MGATVKRLGADRRSRISSQIMGWALVEISPRSTVGISWRNQFIGNLWGVRSGRLIARDQSPKGLSALDRSVSIISTYCDAEEAAERRFLARHGPRDKYRTPINSPLPICPPWANVPRRNRLQGRGA